VSSNAWAVAIDANSIAIEAEIDPRQGMSVLPVISARQPPPRAVFLIVGCNATAFDRV
jgi:hypothetical protein